jgi:hypothetical protein
MILRPLDPPPTTTTEFLPAWSVVEQVQRQKYESCWMITQPSHAALAGDFAARLTDLNVEEQDGTLIRAIELHDAGWGALDAQAIMLSRSLSQGPPKSFIAYGANEFVSAWEKSIDVAESVGPIGGYIVSRHFFRLAQHALSHSQDKDRQIMERFLKNEEARQQRLAAHQKYSTKQLETTTDVLQFCDLLSLFVCCGARQNVEFPEYFGIKARVTVENDTYHIDPILIEPGTVFGVAALRHPATKAASGQEFEIKII